jgi:arginase family enzyme
MSVKWPHEPGDPFLQLLVPRVYGSVPTLFAAPLAERPEDLRAYDIAFLGIPWSAPVPSDRVGAAAANYAGTALTPHRFRTNSIKYGGYLPELDLDVFEHLRLVDYGDVDVVFDTDTTIATVARRVGEIVEAGAMALTMGGNSGPSTYAVLQAVAERAGGPVAVVNFDAHHDNRVETTAERADRRNPRWGATWAGRIFELPNVDPRRYVHVGLRGPRNDRGAVPRFLARGVRREQIYTYAEIARARRSNFDDLAREVAARAVDGTAKVWIAVDPDVLDMGMSPEFGDEPLGLRVEEVVEIARQVGRAAGRRRFAGIAFTAVPPDAMTIQWICIYILLYAFAGVIEAGI